MSNIASKQSIYSIWLKAVTRLRLGKQHDHETCHCCLGSMSRLQTVIVQAD